VTVLSPPSASLTERALRLANNPYLLLALTSLFWSGNHVIGRAASGEVPPLTIAVVRWLVPAVLLWPFVRERFKQDWPAVVAHWKIVFWLAFSGGALFTGLQYIGLQHTNALNVSVLNSLVPVLIVIVSAVAFRDRVTRVQLAGIVVSSLGVIAIVTHGELTNLHALSFNIGDLITLFTMLVFALYSTSLRLSPKIQPLNMLFMIAALSTIVTLPFAVWEWAAGFELKANWLTFGTLAYVSFFPGFAAYALWNRGIGLIGANRAGPFLHLIPVFTAIIATTVLGEELYSFHILGFTLIIGGVWLASRKGKAVPAASAG